MISDDVDIPPTADGPIRELLSSGGVAFTPSETRIVQVLIADYPRAGLGSASSLARRAGVSDPTVVRLAAKLGFPSFAAFQARLLEEVEARLRSPLMMMERQAGVDGNAAADYLRSVARCIVDASEAAAIAPYERAAELILSARGRVKLAGGRFSRHVAGMLAAYLAQIRAGVDLVSPLTAESYDELLDWGRRDLLIVFDYRRYQNDVVALARQAAARGVRIMLFTDPWLSPLAELSELVFVAPLEVSSPYDSLAPAVAQIEALVAHLVARDTALVEKRVGALEEVRGRNAVTLDEDDAGRKRPAGRRNGA